MEDKDVLNEIGKLIDEEHTLLERGPQHQLSPAEHGRLEALQVSLDQCWDLLRQRRARSEFHKDPDSARVRDASTVERFQQ